VKIKSLCLRKHHALETCGEGRGGEGRYSSSTLNLGSRWKGLVSFTFLQPGIQTATSILYEADWASEPVWTLWIRELCAKWNNYFVFNFLEVEWDWVHLARRPLGLLHQPRMIVDYRWSVGGKGNLSTRRKPSPVTLATTNTTWRDLVSNLGRCGGDLATNRLSYGTAICRMNWINTWLI
jgi:hypothetical protein